MSKDRLDKMIKRHEAIVDVVAGAMRDYATIQTGHQWNLASFVFETDYVLSMLAQAGYKIIRRPASEAIGNRRA